MLFNEGKINSSYEPKLIMAIIRNDNNGQIENFYP